MERFGSVRYFVASPSRDQVLVSFVHADDALHAHRALTVGAPGGLPPLIVEFISDVDLQTASYQSADSSWASGLGTAFGSGSAGAGSVWSSGGAVEEHSSFLPSDLFSGGQ